MLRLVPHAQNGHIELILNSRPSIWTQRTLHFALGISLCLHIAALSLVRVPDEVINDNGRSSPPVTVTAEMRPSHETSALADWPVDRRLHSLAPPRSGLPSLPALVERPIAAMAFSTVEAQMQWMLSGPLAGETLLSVLPTWVDNIPLREQRLRFAVQVDQRSGKVLWLNPVEAWSDQMVVDKVEEIIRRLRFQPRPNGGIISGELELFAVYHD